MKKSIRHPKPTIKKACRLYAEAVPLRRIMRDTGIKSTSTILFACNPDYRKSMIERGRIWRKKNPERWLEICRKANLKRLKKRS